MSRYSLSNRSCRCKPKDPVAAEVSIENVLQLYHNKSEGASLCDCFDIYFFNKLDFTIPMDRHATDCTLQSVSTKKWLLSDDIKHGKCHIVSLVPVVGETREDVIEANIADAIPHYFLVKIYI